MVKNSTIVTISAAAPRWRLGREQAMRRMGYQAGQAPTMGSLRRRTLLRTLRVTLASALERALIDTARLRTCCLGGQVPLPAGHALAQ
jgi:hypothetical protein